MPWPPTWSSHHGLALFREADYVAPAPDIHLPDRQNRGYWCRGRTANVSPLSPLPPWTSGFAVRYSVRLSARPPPRSTMKHGIVQPRFTSPHRPPSSPRRPALTSDMSPQPLGIFPLESPVSAQPCVPASSLAVTRLSPAQPAPSSGGRGAGQGLKGPIHSHHALDHSITTQNRQMRRPVHSLVSARPWDDPRAPHLKTHAVSWCTTFRRGALRKRRHSSSS